MSKVHIRPLADRVLVQPAAAEEKQLAELLFLIALKKNLKKEK